MIGIRFASLKAVVVHAVGMPIGAKTLCGRQVDWDAELETFTNDSVDCKACLAAIKRQKGAAKAMAQRVAAEGARRKANQAVSNWGGARKGAGAPKQYVRLTVEQYRALFELYEKANAWLDTEVDTREGDAADMRLQAYIKKANKHYHDYPQP